MYTPRFGKGNGTKKRDPRRGGRRRLITTALFVVGITIAVTGCDIRAIMSLIPPSPQNSQTTQHLMTLEPGTTKQLAIAPAVCRLKYPQPELWLFVIQCTGDTLRNPDFYKIPEDMKDITPFWQAALCNTPGMSDELKAANLRWTVLGVGSLGVNDDYILTFTFDQNTLAITGYALLLPPTTEEPMGKIVKSEGVQYVPAA